MFHTCSKPTQCLRNALIIYWYFNCCITNYCKLQWLQTVCYSLIDFGDLSLVCPIHDKLIWAYSQAVYTATVTVMLWFKYCLLALTLVLRPSFLVFRSWEGAVEGSWVIDYVWMKWCCFKEMSSYSKSWISHCGHAITQCIISCVPSSISHMGIVPVLMPCVQQHVALAR